jgi:hypothetical protein
MRTSAILCLAALGLAGCVSTRTLDAASIDYRLPRTDAQATLELILTGCDPMIVEPTLSVTAVAGAQAKVYHISGDSLGSSTMARSMKIDVNDKGVITAVNSGTTDKRAQIMGDLIKVAAGLAPLIPAAHDFNPPPSLACGRDARNAVRRYNWLRGQITILREQVAAGPGAPDERRVIKQVNAYAAEAAGMRTGDGILHVATTGDIDLGDGPPAGPTALTLDEKPFEKWWDSPRTEAEVNAVFALRWTASVVTPTIEKVDLGGGKSPRNCGHSMPLPKTETVKVLVTPLAATLLDRDELKKGAKLTTPLAQWLPAARLCTDVGFGENRNIGLTFDSFGRTTELQWTSDATLQNISSAAAGAAPDVATVFSTVKGAQLAGQKAEIDQLSTEQLLNQWRACKEILAQGGYSCPQPTGSQ